MNILNEISTLFAEQERNREWFEKNHEKLIEKYNGKFIAIYKQNIIDSDEDIEKLMERVEKKYPPDKISVEYVSKEKIQLIL